MIHAWLSGLAQHVHILLIIKTKPPFNILQGLFSSSGEYVAIIHDEENVLACPSRTASSLPPVASTPHATMQRCSPLSCSGGQGNTHAPTHPAPAGGRGQRSEVNPGTPPQIKHTHRYWQFPTPGLGD